MSVGCIGTIAGEFAPLNASDRCERGWFGSAHLYHGRWLRWKKSRLPPPREQLDPAVGRGKRRYRLECCRRRRLPSIAGCPQPMRSTRTENYPPLPFPSRVQDYRDLHYPNPSLADEQRDAKSRSVHKIQLLTLCPLSPPRVPGRTPTVPRQHPAPQTPCARAEHPHLTLLCAPLSGRLACWQDCSVSFDFVELRFCHVDLHSWDPRPVGHDGGRQRRQTRYSYQGCPAPEGG